MIPPETQIHGHLIRHGFSSSVARMWCKIGNSISVRHLFISKSGQKQYKVGVHRYVSLNEKLSHLFTMIQNKTYLSSIHILQMNVLSS